MCQLCNKIGHVAFKCYNQFNYNFQPADPHVVNNISTLRENFDQVWYTDKGATDHITGKLDKLTMREQYSGKDQVHTASGFGMIISHVGQSLIHTTRNALLKNVLHVPPLIKILFQSIVSLLNNVFVEFHPHYYSIKDRSYLL